MGWATMADFLHVLKKKYGKPVYFVACRGNSKTIQTALTVQEYALAWNYISRIEAGEHLTETDFARDLGVVRQMVLVTFNG